MKELIGTSRNLFFAINEERCKPIAELILMVTEPQYRIKEGQFEQVRPIESIRITVGLHNLRVVINDLTEIAAELAGLAESMEELEEKIKVVTARIQKEESEQTAGSKVK